MESGVIKDRSPARRWRLEISRTARAAEWWEFKLSPILATAYATAFLLKLSIISLWPQLLLTLVALAACAAYVSVINDLTDLKEDLASGKANRLVGKSRAFVAAALTCTIVPGAAVALHWRDDPLLLSLYSASWVAFTLYSLPPVRLKKRGGFGLLADASGAHLFPTLLAVALVCRRRAAPLDTAWFAAVAAWSLSFGVRGILWHQLSDLNNDEKIGLSTFARRHKIALLRGLGNFIIFPAEVAAFCFMLWHAGSPLAFALLCYYALLAFLRKRIWGINLVVVVPEARAYIAMQEYYEVLFPLAFLLSSSRLYPLDALMIVPHLLLFPKRALRSAKDVKIFGEAFKLFMTRIRGR
ncbi:MAG: UbiA family prenyltransferase [Pyrinomonadaceae bacterium]